MSADKFASIVSALFDNQPVMIDGNFVVVGSEMSSFATQQQTNDAFSEKWKSYDTSPEKGKLYEMQRMWYLSLYGFSSEADLAAYLQTKQVIFDAGCGLGYKAAWFAELAPESLVIGMDYSDASRQAAESYKGVDNLLFIKGDIADTPFASGSIDYVSCDQVIMHTESPEKTFEELTRLTAPGGEFACYFYAKKALPRELIDDYFRSQCLSMANEDLWALAEQVTELGRRLSDLKVSFESPEIPALGIKAGTYDVQRFIYWNFLKCFWNIELGPETSVITNFDWYSPSNARRFSKEEVEDLIRRHCLSTTYFHSEEACYSGRFKKQS